VVVGFSVGVYELVVSGADARVLPRIEFADDAVTFDAQEAPGGSSA
jgi:hypothetical protein